MDRYVDKQQGNGMAVYALVHGTLDMVRRVMVWVVCIVMLQELLRYCAFGQNFCKNCRKYRVKYRCKCKAKNVKKSVKSRLGDGANVVKQKVVTKL